MSIYTKVIHSLIIHPSIYPSSLNLSKNHLFLHVIYISNHTCIDLSSIKINLFINSPMLSSNHLFIIHPFTIHPLIHPFIYHPSFGEHPSTYPVIFHSFIQQSIHFKSQSVHQFIQRLIYHPAIQPSIYHPPRSHF